MITNKKGLSDVVTTVIIILLVIAAIGIIWSFVQPTLKKAGEQINTECLTVNIEPVSCNSSIDTQSVAVTRRSGEGTLTAIKVLVENNGATVNNTNFNTNLGVLGTVKLDQANLAAGDKIKVAAVVGANGQVCDASPTVVTCVA